MTGARVWRSRLGALVKRVRLRAVRAFAAEATEGLLAPRVDAHEVVIRVRSLPAELDGLRIAHISDLHVGQGVWRPVRAPQAASAVQELGPDVMVNTGDFLQGKPSIADVTALAGSFRIAGGRETNLAILGNHDYYAGPDAVRELIEGLESAGITVLANRAVQVLRGDAVLSFVGICGDRECGHFEAGVAALLAAPRPRVALIHEPDIIENLPEGAADLVLAGHTHGGQIAVPLLRRRIVKRFCGSDYVSGYYRVNGMPMYVSRGIGCTGFPLRVNASPEVPIIRLSR